MSHIRGFTVIFAGLLLLFTTEEQCINRVYSDISLWYIVLPLTNFTSGNSYHAITQHGVRYGSCHLTWHTEIRSRVRGCTVSTFASLRSTILYSWRCVSLRHAHDLGWQSDHLLVVPWWVHWITLTSQLCTGDGGRWSEFSKWGHGHFATSSSNIADPTSSQSCLFPTSVVIAFQDLVAYSSHIICFYRNRHGLLFGFHGTTGN